MQSVRVALTTSSIRIEPAEVPTGTVVLKLENLSMAAHSVVVLRTALPFEEIAHEAGDAAALLGMGMLARVEIAPTATAELKMILPAARYVIMCSEQAHYDYGMRTALRVK